MVAPLAGRFVWIKGLRGPQPQKWDLDVPRKSSDGESVVVLAAHDLTADEFALSVAILEQRYPPPKVEA